MEERVCYYSKMEDNNKRCSYLKITLITLISLFFLFVILKMHWYSPINLEPSTITTLHLHLIPFRNIHCDKIEFRAFSQKSQKYHSIQRSYKI